MKNIAIILFSLLCTAFCIKQIGEPDIFWQVQTGRYIIDNAEVPKVDVFSYTYAGEEWINVKWATEVLFAFFSDRLGLEIVMIFQLLILLLILLFLYKTSIIYWEKLYLNKDFFLPAFLLTAIFFLVFISYRLNGRPEMMSHLFTAIFIYLFTSYSHNQSNCIFWLIPLQLLWSNMHEGYGVGMVLIVIFFFAILFEKYYLGNIIQSDKKRNNRNFLIAGFLALLTPAIHPFGLKMILYPFNIYGQLGKNQFTTELYDISNSEYWQLPAFFFLVAAIISFYNLSKGDYKMGKRSTKPVTQTFGFGMILMLFAFFILGMKSYRNLPFFAISSFPLIFIFLVRRIKNARRTYILSAALSLVLITLLGNGKFYNAFFEREKYGLRINPIRTPIGAAEFLKSQNVEGKGFVDYLSSSYFLWYLGEEYKSYIDLRDLDVFEQKFMENVLLSYQYPEAKVIGGKGIFQLMDEVDHFDYAVIVNRKEFIPILRYLHKSPEFILCYADPVSSVFVRNSDKYESVIRNSTSKKPVELFQSYKEITTSKWALVLSKILWPFYEEEDIARKSVDKEKFIYGKMLGDI